MLWLVISKFIFHYTIINFVYNKKHRKTSINAKTRTIDQKNKSGSYEGNEVAGFFVFSQ